MNQKPRRSSLRRGFAVLRNGTAGTSIVRIPLVCGAPILHSDCLIDDARLLGRKGLVLTCKGRKRLY